jgi:2-oxoglutarate decarboxylase
VEHRFKSVIDDETGLDQSAVRKVLLCSGKIYYELAAEQEKRAAKDVAVLRVEQLYPVPARKLTEALDRYPNATEVRWVQEEPANQGAWPFFGLALPELLPERFAVKRVSRRPMAAPSAGSSKVHELEQRELIAKAFE